MLTIFFVDDTKEIGYENTDKNILKCSENINSTQLDLQNGYQV